MIWRRNSRGRVARALGIALTLMSISCSGDRPTLPVSGSVLLRLSFPDGGSPRPDSVRIEIRDQQHARVGGVVTALPATGPLDASIEVEVDAANDLGALAQAEGPDGAGRGAIAYGEIDGLDVVGGKATEAEIALSDGIPHAPTVDGTPGVSTYTVRWNRVPGAESYVLRQSDGITSTDLSVADTSVLIGPGIAMGEARLRDGSARRPGGRRPSTMQTFRVRSVLPLGTSLFGDSTTVDLDVWQDLPYVTAVMPADGASGVADTSIPSVASAPPRTSRTTSL